MKDKMICLYADLLLFIEDVIGFCEMTVNDHRGNFEEKHWDVIKKEKGW